MYNKIIIYNHYNVNLSKSNNLTTVSKIWLCGFINIYNIILF